MKIPDIIKTKRLVLRPPKLSDAGDIFTKYATDKKYIRFVAWLPHKSIADTKKFLKDSISKRKSGTFFNYVIEDGKTRELMGMIGFGVHERVRAEIGYIIANQYSGKGYITEASKALIKLLFKKKEISRVQALCDVKNIGSRTVMEKIGMKREGVLRKWKILPNAPGKKPRDMYIYSAVKG